MANIFISHSTIDKALADYLCNAFEERGLSCWIAPRDIVPGAEWAVSITNAITEADVLFVLYSKNAVKSTQVTKEIGIADRKGKYILPYKIDDTEPEGAFDYYLTGCQWIIVDPATGDYKMDELCDSIRNIILQRETKKAEAIQALENIENANLMMKEDDEKEIIPSAQLVKPVKSVQEKTVTEPLPKKKKQTPAQKERRKLFWGVVIVITVLLFLIVAVVGIVVIKLRDVDKQDHNAGIVTDILKPTDEKDFEYTIYGGSVTVTAYIGEDTEVVIPDEIEGYPVKALDEKIFYCNTDITSVSIPEGVTEVPRFAFYKCTSLSSVTLPDSLVIIGEHAFEECSSLTEVKLPDSVAIIDDFAFQRCTALISFDMGSGVTTIGNYAFSTCDKLTEISISDSVTYIGDMAFACCTELTDFAIPQTVTSISKTAFYGCTTISIYYNGKTYTQDISEIIVILGGNEN